MAPVSLVPGVCWERGLVGESRRGALRAGQLHLLQHGVPLLQSLQLLILSCQQVVLVRKVEVALLQAVVSVTVEEGGPHNQ